MSIDTVDWADRLPKYSEYFKFLLVEELMLDDYPLLHYGKCRVIGKHSKDAKGQPVLDNVRIGSLLREYSIPEGTLSLPLLTTPKTKFSTSCNTFVEILGEVILDINEVPQEILTPLTSRGVVEQLNFAKTAEDKKKLLSYICKHYNPALKVWFVLSVAHPEDIISRNLEIRMLEEKEKS